MRITEHFANSVDGASGGGSEGLSVSPLGEFVRRRRLAVGLSQARLAVRVGVESQTISNLETGRTRALRLKHLRPLAEALQQPIETVMALWQRESGELEEPGGVPPLALPAEVHERLLRVAKSNGMTPAEWIERALGRRELRAAAADLRSRGGEGRPPSADPDAPRSGGRR